MTQRPGFDAGPFCVFRLLNPSCVEGITGKSFGHDADGRDEHVNHAALIGLSTVGPGNNHQDQAEHRGGKMGEASAGPEVTIYAPRAL